MMLMSQTKEVLVDKETYEIAHKCERDISQVLRFALDSLKAHYETQDTPSKSA